MADKLTGKKPNWAVRTRVDNVTDVFALTKVAGAALVFPEYVSCQDSDGNPITKVEADFLGTTINLALYINLPKGSKISALALTDKPGVYIKTAVSGTAGWFKVEESGSAILTPVITAGATGVTVAMFMFVAPNACTITKATGIIEVVQTGTDNTPTLSVYNIAAVVGVSAAIALGGTIGDAVTIVLDSAEVELAAGDILQFKVINPTATITVALQAKLQLEWKSTQ